MSLTVGLYGTHYESHRSQFYHNLQFKYQKMILWYFFLLISSCQEIVKVFTVINLLLIYSEMPFHSPGLLNQNRILVMVVILGHLKLKRSGSVTLS